MKKPKDIILSRFENFRLPTIIGNITLFDELRNIKNGTYKDTIKKCREAYKAGDMITYNELKTSLPSVTFSGIFSNSRKSSNLLFYNNIIVIDIDKLTNDNFNTTKNILKSDEHILSLWTSPSGNGLKGLIKVDGAPQDHKLSFRKISEYFKSKYNVDIDKSGSDITRLCFTSSDQHISYNRNAKVFRYIDDKPIVPVTKKDNIYSVPQSPKVESNRNSKKIEDILCYLEKKQISITTEYLNWRNVALAISNTFNEEKGTIFFLRLCRLDGQKHDESKSKILIENIYKNSNSSGAKITLRTIIFLASQKGYKPSLKSLL
jgi:hypothetical protein